MQNEQKTDFFQTAFAIPSDIMDSGKDTNRH